MTTYEQNKQEKRRKDCADKILNERLADLNRRANELTYEERVQLLMEIDREYRESTEGPD